MKDFSDDDSLKIEESIRYDDRVYFSPAWKIVQNGNDLMILADTEWNRKFMIVFGPLFLFFCWILCVWTKGWLGVLMMTFGTPIGIVVFALIYYWNITLEEKAGNFLESDGVDKILLPRNDIVLATDSLIKIALAESVFDTGENRRISYQILLQIIHENEEVAFIPLVTCAYKKHAQEFASAIATNYGLPIFFIQTEIS